jgi:CMP-N-acetylneuraminic acid synthetase
MKYDTVAFIPLRGGSKSIPQKNIKLLAGKSLAFWVTEAALAAPSIDKVFVSTDSEEIREVMEQLNHEKLEVIDRSAETATDTASTELAMLEFAENHEFEDIVLIQATSPFLQSEHLEAALEQYHSQQCDSLFAAVRQKQFIWKDTKQGAEPLHYDPLHRPRRNEHKGVLVETGAFYITSRAKLVETQCRVSGKTCVYEMPAEFLHELDEPKDWEFAEQLLLWKQKK